MIIKKNFAMHEFIEEEEFLNKMASKGKCLERISEDGFEFKECDDYSAKYKVVYSLSEFNSEDYEGFDLVTTYTSSKGGHYHYLRANRSGARLPKNKDRNFMLKNNLSRIERFNGIIIGSLFILFVYLYISYKNPLYFIIILGAFVLGLYVFKLRKKIKKALQQNKKNN